MSPSTSVMREINEVLKNEMGSNEHTASGCAQCTFVPDLATLKGFILPREMKQSATYEPVFCGRYSMLGWTGHSCFYVFVCKRCEELSVDHPHGYSGPGYLRLDCNSCRSSLILKDMKIYQDEGVVAPAGMNQNKLRIFLASLFLMSAFLVGSCIGYI